MKTLRSFAAGLVLAVLSAVPSFGQGVGQLGAGQVLGNSTATQARAAPATLSAMFNRGFCSTANALLANIAGTWGCVAGAANQFVGVNSAGTSLAFNTLSQDCSLVNGVITCTKTNNVAFGPFATQTAPCSIAQGCTNQTTVNAARQSSGLNVWGDQGTGHGDTIVTIGNTERFAYTNAAFTASRAWTLPAANVTGQPYTVQIADMAGGVTGVNTLVITRAGADTINGGTTAIISAANGGYICTSDGSSKWTCQATGPASAGGMTSVTPSGGLVSSSTANCSQTAITTAGTLSRGECVDARTTTSEAIADSDRGKLVTFSNAAAIACTIAQAGTASNFFAGWTADLQNINVPGSAGIVTCTAATSLFSFNGATSATLKIYPGQTFRLVSDGTNYIVEYNGGSNWVLLNTLTASASATLSDTTNLTSAFNEYEIVFANIINATNSTSFELQIHASAAFQSTGYLATAIGNNTGGVALFDNPATFVPLSHAATSANSTPGISGFVRIATPSVAGIHNIYGTLTYATAAGSGVINTSGYWNTSAAVDGFQVLFSSGNITSGTVKIYGRL